MCGIVGYVGSEPCAPLLLDGLRRLEYRGYDSAGIAVRTDKGIDVVRAVGKLRNLEQALTQHPLAGTTGIGHTRWATHGRPSEVNAHPHIAGHIAVVHNGIIENHLALRARLKEQGQKIVSDTDTELVAHLIYLETKGGHDLEQATRRALKAIHGAYAIAVMSYHEPERLIVAKAASPLVLGICEDGSVMCGSDIPALLPFTRDMIIMDDGELAVLDKRGIQLSTFEGQPVERPIRRIDWSPTAAEKSGFKHFMLKEIHEQPRAIEDTLRGRLDLVNADVHGAEIGLTDAQIAGIKRVYLLACGTSHHAAQIGRHYIESITRLPSNVEIASEFRARDAMVGPGDLIVAVSQSGETSDTLAALREAKKKGALILAVANVIDSAIPRESHARFYTHAGPEIGVASTKCFTTQVAVLLMLSIHLGRKIGTLDKARAAALLDGLVKLPTQINDVILGTRQLVANIAKRYVDARDVLFLGRGLSFPIALEGALKLKEISYVHAEGYAAGEMKHGPIALLDASVPVIVVAPQDGYYDKTMSNLQEARAREAKIICIASEGDEQAQRDSHEVVEIPRVDEALTPFLTVLPLQLYSYYVADLKGTDVDQPRNLAKTVTVE
ncbi:MAG: glutamine--fructose-6-phosphate transaminase (isomerizing) [Polyangiales bacterium]